MHDSSTSKTLHPLSAANPQRFATSRKPRRLLRRLQPGKPSSCHVDTATPAQPRVLPPPTSTHTSTSSTHTTPPNLKPTPSPPYRSSQQPKPDRKHFTRSRSKDVGWRIGRNVNTRWNNSIQVCTVWHISTKDVVYLSLPLPPHHHTTTPPHHHITTSPHHHPTPLPNQPLLLNFPPPPS